MLTVKLIKPNRLNKGGVIWERGQEVPVDLETARSLLNDPRFEVIGLDDLIAKVQAEEAEKKVEAQPEEKKGPVKPASKGELYAAIRDAADQLDVDDEDNFTATGKPQVAALEKILGYDITAAERDAAMEAVAPKGSLDAGEDKGGKKGGVVIKRVSSQKSKDQTAPAENKANDPTTSGAVEV